MSTMFFVISVYSVLYNMCICHLFVNKESSKRMDIKTIGPTGSPGKPRSPGCPGGPSISSLMLSPTQKYVVV